MRYTGRFVLDFEGYRFYCSFTSKKVLKMVKKDLEKNYPDVEFITKRFAVCMTEIDEETGRVIKWKKLPGYSLWHQPVDALVG